MKKTFLKATLFSLMVSMVPAVITSCKDYDDDIKSLNTKDDQLQTEISDKLAQQEQALTNQIKALETALAEQKEAAATATAAAKAAADAAQAAADKAQATADAGVKAAAEADAKAQAANMEAEAAKAAAAQAKVDAIEEAKAMVEALRADVAKQMEELDAKYGQKYQELAEAVGKAATKEDLEAAVKSLSADIKALEDKFNASEEEIKEILADYLIKINKNTADIVIINGKLDGIDTEINTLKTDLGKLEGKVAANEVAIAANKTAIANNATAIAANLAAINKINNETLPALKAELEGKITEVKTELATHISAFNTYQQKVDAQLDALELFKDTYEELLAGLQGKLDDIDLKIADLYVKYGEVAGELTQAKRDILANASAIEDLEGVVAANKEELEGLIGDLDQRLTEEVSTLNQAIENAKDALQQSIDGVQTNLDNAVSDLQGKIDTINETLGTIDETLGNHGTRITALEGTVEEQGEAIETLKTDLAQAQRDIVKINGALSVLNEINAKRLTSVTLIPSSYVGGIPTIDFFSAKFVPMVAGANGEYTPAAETAEPMIVTNTDTEALYRLNPSGVMLEDIVAKDVTFVQQVATSRSESTEPVVKVAGVEKDDNGVLVVNATKSASFTSDLNSAGEGKIYTVSLRVPIAPKNYYTWTEDGKEVKESAEDAVVYSEYARVSETTFTPGIAAVYCGTESLPLTSSYLEENESWNKHNEESKPTNFFYTKDEAFGENAPVYLTVPYNTVEFNLAQLVTGSKTVGEGASAVTTYLDNYASYPFTFSYEFVSTPATEGYATVTTEGLLTATNPANNPNINSASRIGKVVTVRVTMKYGNNVVEQKYFNVQYVLTPKPITVYFNDDLYTHFTWNLYTPVGTENSCLWNDTKEGENVVEKGFMTKLHDAIWKQLGNEDFKISRNEFVARYAAPETGTKTYVDLGSAVAAQADEPMDITAALNLGTTGDWIMKGIAVAKDFYEVDGVNGKGITYQLTLNPTMAGFPPVTIVLSGKVVWPEVPVFGVVDSPRTWSVKGALNQLDQMIDNFDQTQKLSPMSYETAVKNQVADQGVHYHGNILTGRTVPYILKMNNWQYPDPLAPVWDIQVADAENTPSNSYNWMVEGSSDVAATVWADQKTSSFFDLGYTSAIGNGILAAADRYNNTVNFVVEDNEAGRILVNSNKPVVLDWLVYLNGKEANNLYTVGHTNVIILKPITKVSFAEIPSIEQNFAEQSVDVASYLRAEDQYTTNSSNDYLNAEGGAFDATNTGKWEYYGFENIKYEIDMTKVPVTEVPYYTQMEIKVDETTGELTFTTKNTTLTTPLNVYIKVSGDYKFGSFKDVEAVVTITNSSISAHARKR